MFVQLSQFLIRRRWAVLLLVVAATLAALILARGIRFDFTPQAVLSDSDGSLARSEAFKQTFGHDDAVLLVLMEAQGERDVLDRELLGWQARLAERLATAASVRKVTCVATMNVARLVVRRPGVVSAPLVRHWPMDAEEEARVRQAIARFGSLGGNLVSRDRRLASMVVGLDPNARDIDAMEKTVGEVKTRLAENPPPPGYRVTLSGFPAIRVEIVRQLRADLAFLVPVAGLVLLAALAIAYRSLSGTIVPLAAVGVGVAWTAAALVLFHQTLGIISSVLPVLMLTVGMSNCVHLVSQYAQQGEMLGSRRLAAVRRTITLTAPACFLAYLTTAIGFGSLIATQSSALTAFGWQAALGMVLLFTSTILVTASLLPSFRPPRFNGAVSNTLSPASHVSAAAGHFVVKHPRSVVLVAAMMVLASLWAARDVSVNSHMMESFDAGHETMQSMRLIEDKLGGFITLDVSLMAKQPGQFLEPDIHRRVREAEQFAAAHSAVLSAQSYVDLCEQFLPESPSSEDARRRQLARSEAMLRSLGEVVGYDAFMSADGRQARIMLRARDLGTRNALLLIDDLEQKLAELFPPGGPVEARLTGDAHVHAKTIDGFIRALLYSLVAASLIIFALIALLFRSLELGLISVAPNLTPLALTLGYMGLRGYDLNITHVIVFAISLGIAVDGTIHFLSRFRREERRAAGSAETIQRSLRGAGRAIVLSNLVVLCGLGVLFFSDFVPTRRFAELGAVTMFAALLGDLLLLPACLMLYHRRRRGHAIHVAQMR